MPIKGKAAVMWYQQLAQLSSAGIPLPEALAQIEGKGAKTAQELSAALNSGIPFPQALQQQKASLLRRDRLLMGLAHQTGSLPETCKRLAAHHEEDAKIFQTALLCLIYPAIIWHAAAILGPVLSAIDFENGGFDAAAYARLAGLGLLLFWGSAIGAWIFSRSDSDLKLRAFAMIPLFGRHLYLKSLADLAFILESMLGAGVRVDMAWAACQRLALFPKLKRPVAAAAAATANGEPASSALSREKVIPADFRAFYKTGEQTGSLTESMHGAAVLYAQRAKSALKVAAGAYSFVMLVAAVGWIIFQIFRGFANYLKVFDNFM